MAVRFESHAEPITGYRLIERLGSGGFGEVWKAEAPGGIFKAIKIIHGDLRNRENDTYRFAEQELKALKRVKQVRHPYLLALDRYDIVEGRLMITMELADCNLWDRFRQCRKQGLPGIPREELLRYMTETAEVLDLFNDKFQLQHLDIKPQNLFLLYEHVKVADFGQVKDLEGLMATVTGGITPVYAAPETFDGFVSRFCDQYSLACVYQELLTGQRPFDGTSMQQLLMQHLQLPPNLQPSPHTDRPALTRALSKKPDDRFPNVMSFVNSIRNGEPAKSQVSVPPKTASVADVLLPPVNSPEVQPSEQIRVSWTSSAPLDPSAAPTNFPNIPVGNGMPASTPLPGGMYESEVQPDRNAPPEINGSGSLRPALIVGLGYTGQRVLQRLQKQIVDRFADSSALPAIRMLYIDTDPDALASATNDTPWEGLAGLPAETVFQAKLNRASHYLKPQLAGRTPLEEWFDPQLLYRLPRVPVTTGLRMFGRLAFSDHYRHLHQKLASELEICVDPQALTDTQVHTRLEVATNRPKVYVVAGLGGGTGSGMFLDMAYALRYRLKKLGYDNPEIVAFLTVPPEGNPADLTPLAQANTYAALTELHHYNREDTTYTVNFDERVGGQRDTSPPFQEVFLLTGLSSPPGGNLGAAAANSPQRPASTPRGTGTINFPTNRTTPGSGVRSYPNRRSSGPSSGVIRTPRSETFEMVTKDPTTPIADYIRTELFSDLGKVLKESRPVSREEDVCGLVRTFGVTKFTWPRAEVIDRVARIVAPVLLSSWVTPDVHHSRNVIPNWIQDQFIRLCLEPELLGTRLQEVANKTLNFNLPGNVSELAAAINPKGWLQRLPEPEQVSIVLAKWQGLIGRPNPPTHLEPSQLEEALAQAAIETRPLLQSDLSNVFSTLVEDPQFRLAGAEEAIRQMHGLIDRTRNKLEKKFKELADQASLAFDQLLGYASFNKPIKKTTASEFSEAIKVYTTLQMQSLQVKAISQCYGPLRDLLACQLLEVGGCRQRVESAHPNLVAEAEVPAAMGAPGELLPPGCRTTEEAAQMFVKSLNDHDLHELDKRIQLGLEHRFGGLYEAGLNSAEGLKGMLKVISEESRLYLDERLGEVDLAGMLAQRYPTRDRAIRALDSSFEEAKPKLIGGGPWAQQAINVVAVPDGAGGEPIQELAMEVLPVGTILTDLPDEIYLYREYPQVPLSAIPQLGPAWSAAYRAAPDGLQCPAHSRADVTAWVDVDSV